MDPPGLTVPQHCSTNSLLAEVPREDRQGVGVCGGEALQLYFWGSRRIKGKLLPLGSAQPAFLGSSCLGAKRGPCPTRPCSARTINPSASPSPPAPSLEDKTPRSLLSKESCLTPAFSSSYSPHFLFLHCQFSRKGSHPSWTTDSLFNPWPSSFCP